MNLMIKTALPILLLGVSLIANAQNHKLEVSLKASAWFTQSQTSLGEIKGYYGPFKVWPKPEIEVLYFFTGNLGIGFTYTPAIGSSSVSDDNDVTDSHGYEAFGNNVKGSNMGVLMQISSDREKRVRIYGSLGVNSLRESYTLEWYDPGGNHGAPRPDVEMSPSGLGYAVGLGMGINISRNIVFNLFDAKYMMLSKDYSDNSGKSIAYKVDSGFIFKLFRQK